MLQAAVTTISFLSLGQPMNGTTVDGARQMSCALRTGNFSENNLGMPEIILFRLGDGQ